MTSEGGRTKRLKDPVYGYIELDADICARIVDAPEFQRLRRVIQTSYGALYPSALHNRFVHSLGVYHLGLLASKALDASVKRLFPLPEDDERALRPESESAEGEAQDAREFQRNAEIREQWAKSLESYRLACLLHDLGHAPFSHSGERFFASEGESLNDDLASMLGDDLFSTDVKTRFKAAPAANHEIMSALLALQRFGDDIPDKVLFARAITGYDYEDSHNELESLDNVLIHMLNSHTIDVDRLDYLIRDAFFVGYESVSIDYRRLLEGLRVVQLTSDTFDIAFHKSSLSVIESVIYARDFEKKWVQSHPAIIYDQFLVQHTIKAVEEASPVGKTIFTRAALTAEGAVEEASGETIRLASDDDIIFIAKNRLHDPLVDELFDRSDRRHPIWKSEAEYRALFTDGRGVNDAVRELQSTLTDIGEGMELRGKALINSEIIEELAEEIEGVDEGDEILAKNARKTKHHLKFLEDLRAFCEKTDDRDGPRINFDFALIPTASFTSGFTGRSLDDIRIVFNEPQDGVRPYRFGDVSGDLTSKNDEKDREAELFFLYHKDAGDASFPKAELVEFLRSYYEVRG